MTLGQNTGRVLKASIVVILSLAAVEVGLRSVPGVIPLFLLVQFDAQLRGAIAARLGYPAQRVGKYLARDDDGPPLWLTMPGQVVRHVVDRRDPEAVPTAVMDWNGFCNPPDRNRQDYSVDLVAIGDSFTWCMAVRPEDTWASRIADLTGLGTYNLSRPAIGLYEYVQLLKSFGVAKRPRIVVVNVYGGNDLRDALKYHRFRTGGSARQPTEPRHDQDRRGVSRLGKLYFALLDGWIGRNSYALSTLLTVANDLYLKLAAAIAPAARGDKADAEALADFRYRVDLGGRFLRFNPDNIDAEEILYARMLRAGEVDLSPFDAAIDEMFRLSQLHRFVMVIAYTPSAHTAYGDRVRFDDSTVADVLGAFSDMQRRYLQAKAMALGFVFVDLTLALRAASANEELTYYPVSLHLTRHGHDAVAGAIVDALRQEAATRGIEPFSPKTGASR